MNKVKQKNNKVNHSKLSNSLLKWYDREARKLPWRIPPELTKKGIKNDPYKIWISEIMLQQTGVKTVQTYYTNFVNKWPKIQNLNEAEENDVLREWSGLGYYRRALNLKKCAKIICDDYDGKFPDIEKELLKLPGIGNYTAAAIISIAFNKPAIVIDGNILRVISRLYEIKTEIKKSKLAIYENLKKISSIKRPGDFAQALMDLGSTICKPVNPNCNSCPLLKYCLAHKNNTYKSIPLKAKRLNKVIKRGYLYIGITIEGKIILIKRPKKGLLGGTICPPTSDWTLNEFPTPNPPFKGNWKILNESIFHSFTHFDLELKVMISTIKNYPNNAYLEPVNSSTLSSLPTVMKKGVELVIGNFIN
tara:strand:- start:1183 stop:2268 length:1086 start_codon:yes stop_codon:yes gene_type:complete